MEILTVTEAISAINSLWAPFLMAVGLTILGICALNFMYRRGM